MIDDAWVVRKLAQIRRRSRNADSSLGDLPALPPAPTNEIDGGVDKCGDAATMPEDSAVGGSDS